MTFLVSIYVSVSMPWLPWYAYTFLFPQTGLDEIREAYRRKLETLMRDVQDLGRAVAIMQVSGSTRHAGVLCLLNSSLYEW
jgi:hypothetical protein